MDAATAATMTATAVRVPQITREKTSNPETVVPQILVEEGGCWVPKDPNSAEVCAHEYGAISGANSAVSKNPMVIINPAINIARCSPADRMTSLIMGKRFHRAVVEECCVVAMVLEPHPRVNKRSDNVHDEVGDSNDDRHEHDDALYRHKIACLHVLHENKAQPIPFKSGLCQHCPTQR